MGDMTLGSLLQILRDAGSLGLMALFVWAILKGWVVVGWLYEEMREDRDQWRDLANKGTALADRAVSSKLPPP